MRIGRGGVVAIVAACGAAWSASAQGWADERYTIHQAGLYSSEYMRASGPNSVPEFMSDSGQLAGRSGRFRSSDGLENGQDTWVWNPLLQTTVQTGLLTSSHTGSDGYRRSVNAFYSPLGFVAGTTDRVLGERTANGANTWIYDPITNATIAIGFTLATYTGTGGRQVSTLIDMNRAGQVVGFSVRSPEPSSSLGSDVWVWSPTDRVTRRIGLQGFEAGTNAIFTGNSAYAISESGVVAGLSSRQLFNGSNGGQSIWAHPVGGTTVDIGLAGSGYTGITGYRMSSYQQMSDTGVIIGTSQRIANVDTDIGRGTWVWNPTTGATVETGLRDGVHVTASGVRASENSFVSNSGHVAGTSTRYTTSGASNGRSTWAWSPTTGAAVQTGLLSPEHFGSDGLNISSNSSQSAAGHVAGVTQRYTGVSTTNGQSTWAWNPQTGQTTQTGLLAPAYIGSNGYHYSENQLQNSQGVVVGRTYQVVNNARTGPDVWVYQPGSATVIAINPTGPEFTNSGGARNATATHLNEAGQVAGVALRSPTFGSDNTATWVWDPISGQTIRTGLTRAANTNPTGSQQSENLFQNLAGAVVGTSTRYAGFSTAGSDAWYFDPMSAAVFRVLDGVPNSANAISQALSMPLGLTDDGFMIGYYNYFADPTSSMAGLRRAFIYRPDVGFTDLDPLVDGGLSANGWSRLSEARFAMSREYIAGVGLFDIPGNQSGQAFVMQRIPGPGGLSLLGLGLFAGARRRRVCR